MYGSSNVVSREMVNGKLVEITQNTVELDEGAVLSRKTQMQGRQAQIKQQTEMLKAEYDSLAEAIADCDTMLSQFAPIAPIATIE